MTRIVRAGRQLLPLLLLVSLFIALAAPASAAAFGDVSGSDWYYNAVDFVVNRGLFLGTSDTAFSPNAAMTRGMFITVLGRYANVDAASWLAGSVTGSGVNLRSGAGTDTGIVATLDLGAPVTIKDKTGDWYQVSTGSGDGYIRSDYVAASYHSFSDVGYGKYYAGYAVWAFERGVVTGDGSSGTFNPSGNITRQEVCTMLSRFASVMGVGLSQGGGGATFTDDGNISSWAKDSVYAMQRSGIVQGDEKGAFNPRSPITRAETAAMIQRFDSACGGFSAPVQRPPETAPAPTVPEQTAPPVKGDPWYPGPGTLLANAAQIYHLSQDDRYCCLATSFSMAANLILGRDEYGAFDWTTSETNDGLSVPSGTSFLGTDGHTYTPHWGSATDLAGLRVAIDGALNSDSPIIASVQSASSANTHYVLFIGWTDTNHTDYLISDPSGGGYILLDDAEPLSESYSLGNKDGTFVYISFDRS